MASSVAVVVIDIMTLLPLALIAIIDMVIPSFIVEPSFVAIIVVGLFGIGYFDIMALVLPMHS